MEDEDGCLAVDAIVTGGAAVSVKEEDGFWTADADCSVISVEEEDAVPPPKKKSKTGGRAWTVEEGGGYMLSPKDEDSSVMDVLLAMAAKLERLTMGNQTGGMADMDWEWTVDQDGCPAGDDVENDGEPKRPTGNELLQTIVEEDGEEKAESTGDVSRSVKEDECLTMTLEEYGITTDGNDDEATLVDEVSAQSIPVKPRRSARIAAWMWATFQPR